MRFLLVDGILDVIPSKMIRALRVFSFGDGIIESNWQKQSVVFETLLMECMAQTGGWLVAASGQFQFWCALTRMQGLVFEQRVSIPNILILEATLIHQGQEMSQVAAVAKLGNGRVASAKKIQYVHFPHADEKEAEERQEQFHSLIRQGSKFLLQGGNELCV